MRVQELMTGTKKAEEGVQKVALFIKFGGLGQISYFQMYFIYTTICFSSPKAINSLGLLPVVQVIAGDDFIHQIFDPYIIWIIIFLAPHNSFHATHYLRAAEQHPTSR